MRRFIQIVLLLLLLAAGGTAWYLYNKGFTKPWREWVVEELRKRGVEVSFSKLTVEPFRGLVAKNVKVFESAERKRVFAKVDEIVIEANYAHAARGEPFLDALTLVDASISFPLDPKKPNGPAVKIEKLNTRIHLPPKQLLVARLDAEVFGIRVSASGQFANLEMAAPPEKPVSEAGPPDALVRAVEVLRALQFEGRAPRLDVRFSGDLSKPETLVVECDLSGEKIRHGVYLLESLAMTANWRNRALVIPRFEARDTLGRLQLSASYQSVTGTVEARLRSGMDLPALFRATGVLEEIKSLPQIDAAFRELTFNSIPQLELSTRITVPAPGRPREVKGMGQVRVGEFRYGEIPMEKLSGDFSWDGKRWAVRDLEIKHAHGGELHASAQQDFKKNGEGDFRLKLESTLNPELFGPYLRSRRTEEARVALARLAMFKFQDAPRITLNAQGEAPYALGANKELKLSCTASGEITFGRTTYRSSEASSGHANLRFNGRVLNVDNFVVHRAEGIGGGELAFDLQEKLVHIKNVRSALHPLDVMVWIQPDLQRDISPYRFGKKPPMLLINGVVDQRRPPVRTRLDVKMEAPAMDYTFCGKELHFTNVDARMAFTDERLKLADVRAELFGGTVKGEGDISIQKSKPGHTATLRFNDVNFQKLTKLYFNYDESQGKLDATYSFTGAGENARTMRGEGDMAVTDGNVFAIPFLGPFSDILSKIVPGMGHNKAHKASAKFSISNGIIATKDFVVEGKGFSMIGDGRIWFLDDRMDFDMRVNARGLPGVVLFPVSKLTEYTTQSKFSEPNWRLKIIPRLGPDR